MHTPNDIARKLDEAQSRVRLALAKSRERVQRQQERLELNRHFLEMLKD